MSKSRDAVEVRDEPYEEQPEVESARHSSYLGGDRLRLRIRRKLNETAPTEHHVARHEQLEFASLSETEIAALASEAAVTILRAATRESEVAMAKAKQHFEEKASEATTVLALAQKEADEIRRGAIEESARVRDEAAAAAEILLKEAKSKAANMVEEAQRVHRAACDESTRLRAEAVSAAEVIRSEAHGKAASMLKDADDEFNRMFQAMRLQRKEFVADLEAQRRFITSLLDDAANLKEASEITFIPAKQPPDQPIPTSEWDQREHA